MNTIALIVACLVAVFVMTISTLVYFTIKNRNILILVFAYVSAIALGGAIGISMGLIPEMDQTYGPFILLVVIMSWVVGYMINWKINLIWITKRGLVVTNVQLIAIEDRAYGESVQLKYKIKFEDACGQQYKTVIRYDIYDIVRLHKMGSEIDIKVRGNDCIVATKIDKSIEVTEESCENFKKIYERKE